MQRAAREDIIIRTVRDEGEIVGEQGCPKLKRVASSGPEKVNWPDPDLPPINLLILSPTGEY